MPSWLLHDRSKIDHCQPYKYIMKEDEFRTSKTGTNHDDVDFIRQRIIFPMVDESVLSSCALPFR